MLIIGISDATEYHQTCDMIEKLLNSKDKKAEILILSEKKACEGLFDIIICAEESPKMLKLLKDGGCLLVDFDKDLCRDTSEKSLFITCGLNAKCEITVSSITSESKGEKIQFCIQKTISTISGKKLLPQEFPVITKKRKNISSLLMAVAAAVVTDTEISDLSIL